MSPPKRNQTITAVEGIRVGHATNRAARTGCTVILCEAGAVAGVDVRGSAPGTRETDVIRPGRLVQKAHAILLTGGSAFGLDAAAGIMQYLEERDVGFPVGSVRVPIVPAAVIFDLGISDAKVRPDRKMGYQACVNATGNAVEMGQVGAGAGATVGKVPGFLPSGGGIGSACWRLSSGVIVGTVVVVNAVGNIMDKNGKIIAGAKNKETGKFVDIVAHLSEKKPFETRVDTIVGTNTTIGVVATNANLTPAEITKVAEMAHDGLARAIRPAHTMFDGDTLFALSTGTQDAPTNTVGIVAAELVAEATIRAVSP